MELLPDLTMLGYVVVALLLGGCIGFERELADKPAGMRTHMLVAGAAALLVLCGDGLISRYEKEFPHTLIQADPIRVIEALVAGVAFLGAGTIIRRGGGTMVEGLTTAATLLFTAAIGVSVAVREVILAVGATVLALITLRVAGALEARLKKKSNQAG